jgi:hypothetical protein
VKVVRLLALASVLTACGGSDGDAAEPSADTGTVATTGATTTGGIDPLAGAGTNPVSADAAGPETALLERVALGRHEGFDRVVFEFRNDVPGYRVSYVDPPLHEDGSGDVVEVDGAAFLVVRMEPASGFDLSVDEGELVYRGPSRISGADAGTPVIREAVRTGDFEAVLSWAIGLGDRVDFRVQTLSGPPRLVVDVRNH